MVALNYARDVRIGDRPARAVALGSNFVWPPLPGRLFLRGQSMVYDFVGQKYAVRLPDNTIDYTTNVNALGILTRASTGTYWGPSGTLLEAAVDEARIQHDPVTGEPLGVLIEPSATNWVSNNTSFSSNYADFSSVDDTDPVMGSVVRVTAVAAGESSAGYSMSFDDYPIPEGSLDASPGILRVIYAKPVTADYVSLRIASGPNGLTVKLSTAEIVQSRGPYSFYVKALTGGWVQIAFYQPTSATSNGPSTNYRLLIGSNPKEVYNGQGIEYAVGDEVLLAYPSMYQAVPEGPPQSIIPTSGSPVTRAADNAAIDLSDVFNPDEGTLRITAQVPEGEVVASLGDIQVVSDSDEKKSYRMTYSDYAGVPTVSLGNGIHSKLEYFPEAQS